MKKTIVAVAVAALVSTGAYAKPAFNHAPKPHNDHHGVQMVDKHAPKPANHSASHRRPQPIVVAQVRPTPPPAPVHHHHHHHHDTTAVLLGDALIAFAILASNAM